MRWKQRETEGIGERGVIAGKGGSLARHYPQSNPQFKVREEKERKRLQKMRESEKEGAI